MKIGIIYYQYPLYEKGSYIQEFVDSIASECESVILIASLYPSKSFDKPKNLIIKWVPLIKVLLVGDLFFNLAVFFKCLTKDFRKSDVVNVISARGAFAAFLFAKIFKKPIICTIEVINNKDGRLLDRLFNKIQKRIYTLNYDKIICWSRYYYNKYLRDWGVNESMVSIIPSGINTERYNPNISGKEIRDKFPAKSLLIVFAKPMYEYNRIMAEFLLESIKLLEKKIDTRVLLGSGEQKSIIEKKIKALQMADRVSFMPFVSILEIPKYLAASDIIVLPFTYEATTSRSLLESMAMAKPIITTDIGEISDIITNGKEAILVKPKKEEVAQAIEWLFFNKEAARRLGTNARILAEKQYSIKSIAKRTREIYEKTTNPRGFKNVFTKN